MALCSGSLRLLRPLSRAALEIQRVLGTRSFGSAAGGGVAEIATDEAFQAEVKKLAEAGSLGVVDFTAQWCGPCKAIAPVLEQLSKQYPGVKFFKVDIDNAAVSGTVMDHSVTAVPTFAFYKGARRVDSFAGARVDLLKECLAKYG